MRRIITFIVQSRLKEVQKIAVPGEERHLLMDREEDVCVPGCEIGIVGCAPGDEAWFVD